MRVRVGDVRLFTTVEGPGVESAPVVLGLHGGPGQDGGQLRFFLHPVAHYAQVVVPDQRGNGRSDHSTPDRWNLDMWADDVAGLIDMLGLERVVLVGTSFGGFVAQAFLGRHPGLVAGAVVVGASPRKATDGEIVERYRQLGGDRAAAVMARSLHDSSPEAEEAWVEVCGPLATTRPPSAELLAVRERSLRTPEVNAHFTAMLGDIDLRAGLAKLSCPLLVMVGENDPLVPSSFAAEAVDAAPGGLAELMIVPGASHQVFWDAPDIAYPALQRFIEQHT